MKKRSESEYVGGESPRIGDLILCLDDHDSETIIGEKYRVEHMLGNTIYLAGRPENEWWYPDRFKLLQRKEHPMPESSQEPLVVWPRPDNCLRSGNFPHGTFFTIDADPQKVWRVVRDGYVPAFGDFTGFSYFVHPHSDTPVRRLKVIRPPQFTVE